MKKYIFWGCILIALFSVCSPHHNIDATVSSSISDVELLMEGTNNTKTSDFTEAEITEFEFLYFNSYSDKYS